MKTTRFSFVFGDSAVLITAKKVKLLDEYREKVVRSVMGCNILQTN